MATIYTIRVYQGHNLNVPHPQAEGWVTIYRYPRGADCNPDTYNGFGPTLRDQLCDARAKLKAALKGGGR